MKTPHTMCERGKRVLVVLKSGVSFEDRFVERTRGKRLVFDRHTVPVGEVRQFITSPKIQRAKARRRVG